MKIFNKTKMKLILILFLGLTSYLYSDNFTREWEYTGTEYFKEYYPENTDEYEQVLEEVRNLVIQGLYMDASEIIQSQIRMYDIESQNPNDLRFLFLLVKMDASIDYFLLNNKRSGLNKNYIVSYICDRFDINQMHIKQDRTLIDFTITEKNSLLFNTRYRNDSYNLFKKHIQYLNIPSGNIGNNNEFKNRISFYAYDTDMTVVHGIRLGLMYDYLLEELFYMSDYMRDICLECNEDEKLQELCTKALSVIGEDIPIIESYSLWSIEIYVTHRKDQAVEFFNRYYR